MDLIYREASAKASKAEDRTVDVIASTATQDSHDEVVEQSWDLDRFKKNPVVLYRHNVEGFFQPASPRDTLPIGRASDVKIEDGRLAMKLRFVDEKANPLAEMVWQGFKQGSLSAVSVGFRPKNVRLERHDDEEVVVLSDNELFEISVVPIPANPDAVAKFRAKTHEILRALATGTKDVPAPSGLHQETTMNELEKAKAEIAQKDAELTRVKGELADRDALVKDFKEKNEVLLGQTKTLAAERDVEKARADKAEGQAIDAEVEMLVGKKITPAEKAAFVKLRKSDKGLFEEMISQRKDMKLEESVAGKGSGTGAENREEHKATGDQAGDDYAELVDKQSNAGGQVLATGVGQ